MDENQQKGLLFMLSSTKTNTQSKQKERNKVVKREDKLLIKDDNDNVENVISDIDEDNNYEYVVKLMRSLKDDKNKN